MMTRLTVLSAKLAPFELWAFTNILVRVQLPGSINCAPTYAVGDKLASAGAELVVPKGCMK